jgi:hypothetical protein
MLIKLPRFKPGERPTAEWANSISEMAERAFNISADPSTGIEVVLVGGGPISLRLPPRPVQVVEADSSTPDPSTPGYYDGSVLTYNTNVGQGVEREKCWIYPVLALGGSEGPAGPTGPQGPAGSTPVARVLGPYSSLAEAAGSTDTTLYITTYEDLVFAYQTCSALSTNCYILIGNEAIQITALPTSPALTVARGQLGTSATTHAQGATVQQASYLAYAMTSGATTMTLYDSSPFPSTTTAGLFFIQIASEVLKVTASTDLSLASARPRSFPPGGGSGYVMGDVLTLTGGTFATAATVTVTGVSAGAVTSVNVTTGGVYTAGAGTSATTGGTGTGCVLTCTFATDVYVVTRAQFGTTAASHAANVPVTLWLPNLTIPGASDGVRQAVLTTYTASTDDWADGALIFLSPVSFGSGGGTESNSIYFQDLLSNSRYPAVATSNTIAGVTLYQSLNPVIVLTTVNASAGDTHSTGAYNVIAVNLGSGLSLSQISADQNIGVISAQLATASHDGVVDASGGTQYLGAGTKIISPGGGPSPVSLIVQNSSGSPTQGGEIDVSSTSIIASVTPPAAFVARDSTIASNSFCSIAVFPTAVTPISSTTESLWWFYPLRNLGQAEIRLGTNDLGTYFYSVYDTSGNLQTGVTGTQPVGQRCVVVGGIVTGFVT